MLEAKLNEAAILKRLLDAVKELVTDANFECNEEGINLQAMDNSHVALVAVKLESTGFKRYRCDRPMPLGVNINSLTKVLKCAKDDDICTLKAADDGDILNLTYEARNSDRIAEYDMKLMDIDSDQLGIPDTEYDARVTMPASEFSRIVRDLSQLGESVRIEVSKEGVRFASDGEAANGSVLLKQSEGIGATASGKIKAPAKEESDGEEPGPEDEEDDEEGGSKKKVKKEKVKKEDGDAGDEEDVEMNGDAEEDEEFKGRSDNEDEEDEEEQENKKRKKKASTSKNGKPSKKAKRSLDDDPPNAVRIEMNQHVTLTFSLKYLVNFSKSATLADKVQLMMSNDVPLLVSYEFGQGYIRYYLAPKIGDD
ncbi:proliferating cell nuclear antigen [Gloeophyllum trabeum ATCC 11539]|uniref:DNA sliding clamp PCNA n=1 Tax=Gloeophyllum trabeum (strain ATCC 11539 / FP-39264 / Madison 617) TaxID=670483 RepID=S7RFI4_GLOTA|nr:proliferating cell nuclear antigen [Gloeophyllum trabeum ATCC 11539]EPQ52950.1 proliferating cell nuclear antigen [Gloeophyllum trabeum ATCC 11539]